MKYLIISLFILVSCKERNKEDFSLYKKNQDVADFYELIMNEVKEVDTEKFYITHCLNKHFEIKDQIKKSIVKINLIQHSEIERLSNKFFFKNYTYNLSNEIKSIINSSTKNHSKKIELHYSFSKPFELKKNTVIIFNTIHYKKPNSSESKAGTERVFLFTKEKGKWNISKKKNLIDI